MARVSWLVRVGSDVTWLIRLRRVQFRSEGVRLRRTVGVRLRGSNPCRRTQPLWAERSRGLGIPNHTGAARRCSRGTASDLAELPRGLVCRGPPGSPAGGQRAGLHSGINSVPVPHPYEPLSPRSSAHDPRYRQLVLWRTSLRYRSAAGACGAQSAGRAILAALDSMGDPDHASLASS